MEYSAARERVRTPSEAETACKGSKQQLRPIWGNTAGEKRSWREARSGKRIALPALAVSTKWNVMCLRALGHI